jgi:creatinine amidohydrolase
MSGPDEPVHEVPTDTQLCIADEATFWPWVNWADFANWDGKDRTLVVVPVAGLADAGLDAPLDAEETLLMTLLRDASLRRGPELKLLVLPPIRFVVGPQPGCAFAVDPDVACTLLEEVITGVGAAGFTKIVTCNASPWMEELCKAVGRDLRIAQRLQMFNLNLSALGLDFHPARGGDRAALRSALQALYHHDGPGSAVITKASAHLGSLLGEMAARGPLPRGGALPMETWP